MAILPFPGPADFEAWLSEHHADTGELWIKIAKKGAGIPSITYDEALDLALCFGWIDGQRKSLDDQFFIQRFTPRRARSPWSKRNVAKVAALEAAGRMRPSGQAEVAAAKADGRWANAYDGPKDTVPPPDLLVALEANPVAKEAFGRLGRTRVFQIVFDLHNAKRPETRRRRIERMVEALAAEGREVSS